MRVSVVSARDYTPILRKRACSECEAERNKRARTHHRLTETRMERVLERNKRAL